MCHNPAWWSLVLKSESSGYGLPAQGENWEVVEEVEERDADAVLYEDDEGREEEHEEEEEEEESEDKGEKEETEKEETEDEEKSEDNRKMRR